MDTDKTSKDSSVDSSNSHGRSDSPAKKRYRADHKNATTDGKSCSTPPREESTNATNTSASSAVTFKILTFNVAEFQPHSQAPVGFNPRREFLKELKKHKPDVLALQELPDEAPSFPGYDCIGTARSHCGFVGMFTRTGFMEDAGGVVRTVPSKELMPPEMMAAEPPFVLASIILNCGKYLVIGSCHLEPFKQGASIRYAQLEAVHKESAYMVLAGDMNMRKDEDGHAEDMGWEDAWKKGGGKATEQFTWDSKVNLYHRDGFGFHCRFDRIYLRNIDEVKSFRLIANEPIDNGGASMAKNKKSSFGNHFYLSDHFGIVSTLTIEP